MVDKIEVIWTVAVAAIVAWVFVVSLDTLQAIEEPPEGTTELKVTASRFLWRFDYPVGEPVFADAKHPLELVVDEPVHFTITSTDVIHSFFVPEFGIKIDAVPGRLTDRSFTPTVAGEFFGRCYEFCGVGHHEMTFPVVVFEAGDGGRPLDQKFGAAPKVEEPVDQGGAGNETGNETGREVEIALSEWKVEPKTLQAEPGETITFQITNEGEGTVHNFQIRGLMDAPSDTLEEGASTEETVTMPDKPGTYTYICAVSGHEALGMKGTLTVGEGGGKGDGDGVPGFDAAVGVLAVIAGVVLFAATRRRK